MFCTCTDGLTDTLDIENEFWEDNNNPIYTSLKKLPGMSAKNTVESFMKDMNNLIENATRTNDITFLAVNVNP
jgi:serine phosphatase RsbU (regulator of sigma subunit)